MLINGTTVIMKVTHVRLCHSWMPFVLAYRETQEMAFDAHDRAFAFFKGACERGIYDDMKTAVEAILVGKDRACNRRFLQMGGRYLVEPAACSTASGPPPPSGHRSDSQRDGGRQTTEESGWCASRSSARGCG